MPKRIWTMERVISDIQEMEKMGANLRHGSVQEEHKRLVSAAIRYFGSWRAAVEASGVDYGMLRKSSEDVRLQKVGKWSNERIVQEIKELQSQNAEMNAVIIKNKYPALFSAAVSPRYFGNWRNALTAAGVNYDEILSKSPRGRPRRKDVWHAGLILEKIKEMAKDGANMDSDYVSARFARLHRLATIRFGSWHAALECALEESSD